ncbi:MAG: hypothetical protein AMS15_09275 [Planctomycetes bacterium DG_23]|nr:MAG: hypothetical protein AMS15_09275 [Planctomycetes bacterium DG_23]
MNGERKIKIGIVPYLNARPLVYGLKEEEGLELIEEVPSKLARLLAAGEIDCGIISSIEYFRQAAAGPATAGIEGARIIPDISISALGEVWSIRLFSKVPLAAVKSVALDESSRTSAALTKIIFKERFKKEPKWQGLEPNADLENLEADAALLIGDPAMLRKPNGFSIYDLGKLWQEMTHLAFVYALWLVPSSDKNLAKLPALLAEAKARGTRNFARIAKREGKRLGLREAFCYEYLAKIMRYDLGAEELAGLKKFYKYAVKYGLAPQGVEMRFFGDR